MNLKRAVITVLMLILTFSGIKAQFVVVGSSGSNGQDWSSPEIESMLRTYIKQVFQKALEYLLKNSKH